MLAPIKFLTTPLGIQASKRLLSSTVVLHEKWDLLTAVCIERRPIITPPLNKLEEDFKKYLARLELERSVKSDHEMRHEKELKLFEQLKKGDDVDVQVKQTAQDIADAATEELAQFTFSPKITDADKKNDVTSLDRKLDKHLVLLVNQVIGKKKHFLLPQGARQEGETLRQTADRVLKEFCGDEFKAFIYGNAPSGFYKYKYPKSIRDDSKIVGAKIFIYFARYVKGTSPHKGIEYKWLDRQELKEILPSNYENSLSQMLIDE